MIYQRVQEEDELSYTVWSLVMVREPVTSARAEVLPARSALTLEKSRNNSPILVFSRNILSRSTVAITGTSVRTGKTRRPWWRQSRGLETARRQRDRGFSSAAKKKNWYSAEVIRVYARIRFSSRHGETHPSRACSETLASLRLYPAVRVPLRQRPFLRPCPSSSPLRHPSSSRSSPTSRLPCFAIRNLLELAGRKKRKREARIASPSCSLHPWNASAAYARNNRTTDRDEVLVEGRAAIFLLTKPANGIWRTLPSETLSPSLLWREYTF